MRIVRIGMVTEADWQIADRLCCAFGQDVLDTLFARETLAPTSKKLGRGRKRQQARPYFFFALSLGYVRKCPSAAFGSLPTTNGAVRLRLRLHADADASLSGPHFDLLLHASIPQRRHQFIRLHPPIPIDLESICRNQRIGIQEIRKREPVSDPLCGYRGEIPIGVDAFGHCFEEYD